MQLSVKEEVKHQISLIINWISLLFTNIFLRFFKPYFSDPPGQLLVLDEGMLGIKLYMLSGLHWLFATNLSWKWLQVAELSWKGVNWVHLKNCRYFFFAKVRCCWVIWHRVSHVPLLDDRTVPVLECLAVLECSAVSGRLLASQVPQPTCYWKSKWGGEPGRVLASQLAGLCLFLPAQRALRKCNCGCARQPDCGCAT